MKSFVVILLLALSASVASAQTIQRTFDFGSNGVSVVSDKRLTAVLAAIEAGGIKVPLTQSGEELRAKLKTEFATADRELVAKMEYFIKQYRSRHAGSSEAQLAAPFISMAFTLSDAPRLEEPKRDVELPGELLEVLDFSPLVRQFYRTTIQTSDGPMTVGQRLDGLAGLYQKSGDGLRQSAAVMITDITEYLNTRPQTTFAEQTRVEVKTGKGKPSLSKIEVRERDRSFKIVPELLVGKGTVNFLNFGDQYVVIVPPETDLSVSEARRSFIQFVMDPIVLANGKEIFLKRDGLRALLDEKRRLDPNISPDINIAIAKSVVVAVDVRERAFRKMLRATEEARRNVGRKPLGESVDSKGRKMVQLTEDLYLIDGKFVMPKVDDEIAAELSDAYEGGAVLAFYFSQQFKGLEDSGFDIASSLRDMIAALDPAKESGRLAENADARKRAALERERAKSNASAVLENPVTKRLIAIDELIRGQKYQEAEEALKALLGGEEQSGANARIYYNLGRVKSLSAAAITDVDARNVLLREAKGFFDQVLKTDNGSLDPVLKSLTYVNLARLYEYYDQNEYALKIYEAAIAIGNLPGSGYVEAVQSKERLLKKQ